MIGEGWIPQGGVSCYGKSIYMQAMVTVDRS